MKNLVFWLLLCGILILHDKQLHAKDVNASPFYALKSVEADYIGIKAFDILTLDLRVNHPADVLTHIEYILQLAEEKNDKALVCVYYETLANYHSMRYDRINDLATKYHEQALQIALQHNLEKEIFRQNFNFGNYFYTYAKLGNAYAYFRKAMERMELVGETNIPSVWKYYLTLSRYFYDIEEYDLSAKILQNVLAHNRQLRPREFFDTLNTLGLISLYTNKPDEAMGYFTQIYEKANGILDSAWMGIAYGNMGDVYVQKGDINKAMDCYGIDYQYNTRQSGDIISALGSLKKIAQLRYDQADFVLSLENINEYLHRIERKPARYKQITEAYSLKMKLLDTLNLKDQELAAIKQFNKYNTLYLSLSNKASIELWKLKEEQQKFESLYQQSSSYSSWYAIVISSFVTSCLIVGGMFYLYSRRRKNNESPISSPLTQLSVDLSEQQSYDVHLIMADKRFHVDERQKQTQISLELREVLKLNLLNSKNWEKFKHVYEENFPGFFNALISTHPELTDGELRLLALVNLHISNNELAEKLSISLEGVKKAKQRLKKKINHEHFTHEKAFAKDRNNKSMLSI